MALPTGPFTVVLGSPGASVHGRCDDAGQVGQMSRPHWHSPLMEQPAIDAAWRQYHLS